jgi:hypothetical protein
MWSTLTDILALKSIDLLKAAVQVLTGRFLTEEQIQNISKNTVGSYFADWLPLPPDEEERQKRIEQAQNHIAEASKIISVLKDDLENQTRQLDVIINEIEEKKRIADHYATLAKTSQESFDAFKAEMEGILRKELRAEAEKGKLARQVVAVFVWTITLVLGAALGAYFIPLVTYIRGFLNK